jgi:hypothetical protein
VPDHAINLHSRFLCLLDGCVCLSDDMTVRGV